MVENTFWMFRISIFFELIYEEFAEQYQPWLLLIRNRSQNNKKWVDTAEYFFCQEWHWEIYIYMKNAQNMTKLTDLKKRNWILGRNPDHSLPPCYSLSPHTALTWGFYFFKLTQLPTCFFKLTKPLMYFNSSVTVHCKGERRKTW